MPPAIARLAPADLAANQHALARLLVEAVRRGAGVGFLAPLSMREALAYWEGVRREVAAGERRVLAAFDAGALVGAVQWAPAARATGRHRAEVHKLLVHHAHQRQGVGSLLMRAVEDDCRAAGRTLLVLDTFTGSDGDHLYRRSGWTEAGRIPDYATRVDGALGELTLFWKKL